MPTNIHRNVNIQANVLYAMHQLVMNLPETEIRFMAVKANITTKPTLFSVFIAAEIQSENQTVP